MALETATFISQLVSSNPAVNDPTGQGDNHLRLIKSALQATVPNWTAVALASTQAQIDAAAIGASNAGVVSPTSGALLVPPGTVHNYAGPTCPAGYLFCDGASYSTATYAALFLAIGSTYGSGSGTFNVPDLRGRAAAGNDAVTNRLSGSSLGIGSVLGASSVTITAAQLPAHTHNYTGTTGLENQAHAHAVSGDTYGQSIAHTHAISPTAAQVSSQSTGAGGGGASFATSGAGSTGIESADHYHYFSVTSGGENAYHNHNFSGTTDGGAVGGASLSIVQPTIILNYMIKT